MQGWVYCDRCLCEAVVRCCGDGDVGTLAFGFAVSVGGLNGGEVNSVESQKLWVERLRMLRRARCRREPVVVIEDLLSHG
jgi:hypothetical protein